MNRQKPRSSEIRFTLLSVSLIDTVRQLTTTELSDLKNIAAIYALVVLEQLARCPQPTFETMSDQMLKDWAYILSQVWEMKPNLKQCASRAFRLVDSIEARTSCGEGEAIQRLQALEKVLVERNTGVKSATRGFGE